MNSHDQKPNGAARNCEEIQGVLLPYMTRELGKARSELVSRHLRKCPECLAAAAEIQATLDWIKSEALEDRLLPARLTEKHRKRVQWSVNHPLLDWMIAHHTVISLSAILGIVWYGCRERTERENRAREISYPIDLRPPRPPPPPLEDTHVEPPLP